MTKVKELMVKNVFVISGEETVLDSAKQMDKYNVGLLVVVEDMVTRRPIGVISDRDIITKVIVKGLSPGKAYVKDIMSTNLVTSSPKDDLQSAVEKMKKNKVKRLPVIDDDGNLAGILSFSDVIKQLAEFKQKLVEFAVDF